MCNENHLAPNCLYPIQDTSLLLYILSATNNSYLNMTGFARENSHISLHFWCSDIVQLFQCNKIGSDRARNDTKDQPVSPSCVEKYVIHDSCLKVYPYVKRNNGLSG